MSRLTSNKSNDDIKNKAISIIRNLTAENDLSYDELAVLSSFLLIERTENTMLKHYEDLEEQGRLIELPCKVGDKVYSVHSAGLSHAMIAEVYADAFCLMLCVAEGRFGKTVFTTREEAEAKLKEMEGAE